MFDEDFYLDLPAVPQEAFPIFERNLKKNTLDKITNSSHQYSYSRSYLEGLIGFSKAYNYSLNFSYDIPYDETSFWAFFHQARSQTNILLTTISIKNAQNKRNDSVTGYALNSSIRQEVHRHIGSIRQLVQDSHLQIEKKERLFAQLNNFANEVDQERTPLGRFGGLFVSTCKLISEGAEELRPAVEILERISAAMGGGEEKLQLPAPEKPKQIEGPKNRLPAPEREANSNKVSKKNKDDTAA